ncbi:MAG TPA: glycosyltransferase family 39 protein, partial [Chloroflexota bacterium]
MLWDEGADGIAALQLFRGHFPIYFPEFGGFEPLFLYTQALALKLFGWSVFSFRVPAVWYGTLAVAATFLVTRKLFGWRVAWIGTFIAASGFWLVSLSRISHRGMALALMAALTMYWLVRWLRSEQPWLSASMCGLFL